MAGHYDAIRVLLWAPFGAGSHYNGAGMAAFRLFRGANSSSLRVDLAHGVPNQGEFPGTFEHHYKVGRISNSAFGQIRFLSQAKLWQRGNVTRYDVFLGLTGFEATVRPAWWAECHGVPSIIKIANSHSNLGDKPGIRKMLGVYRRRRKLLDSISAFIAISQEIGEELKGYGVDERRIHRIPNGVDTCHFTPVPVGLDRRELRAELGLRDEPTVLFVGELVRRKRPHLLIEALRYAPDFHAVLVGPRPDERYCRYLMDLAATRGVERRVTLVDFTPRTADYYKAADLFCLPSANEGMSNALLEAQSSGLPCICCEASGMRDVILDGENGFVVDPTGPALGQALTVILGNQQLSRRLALGARDAAVEKYSLNKIRGLYISLFSELAGRSAGQSS